jgi:hypothetical protein
MTEEEFQTAYETAMELMELSTLLKMSGDPDRQEEAEDAYRQAVAIRKKLP